IKWMALDTLYVFVVARVYLDVWTFGV
nr:tyrosine kinase {catalytic domain, clone Xltk34, subdomain VIII} [Xenopus laevis, Peptide Partial, 26 aa] [Xenopus laevis]